MFFLSVWEKNPGFLFQKYFLFLKNGQKKMSKNEKP